MTAVTILGRGPSWKQCQFRTPELWGTASNLVVPVLGDKPYTKVFAFDGPEDKELLEALRLAKERHIPIVSNKTYATELLPIRDIVRTMRSSFFMNSLSYMLAYALYLDFSMIFIDGIDAGPQWDYQFGKDHIIYWLGFATAKGIDLRIGRDSLRWCYHIGLDTFPKAFMVKETQAISNHIHPEEEVLCQQKS